LLWKGKKSTEQTGTVTSVDGRDGAAVAVGDTYWTVHDTTGPFTAANGVKAGQFILNTTDPAPEDVGFGGSVWYAIREVVGSTEIKVEMLAYNPATILITGWPTETYFEGLAPVELTSDDLTLWATSDGWKIPAQLYGCFTTTESHLSITATSTPTEITEAMVDAYNTSNFSSRNINGAFSLGTYDTVYVHNTVAPQYLLRLLMKIEGYAKSINGGTYWDSDKFRCLWNAAIMDTWLPQTRLSCVFDINNVPNTTIMTTYNDPDSNDGYGSVFDSRTKTLWNIIAGIQEKSGIGEYNSLSTTFSYLTGRDGRMEYRPKYNAGHDFSRDNLMVSDLSTDVAGQVSHVRVFYRNGQAFVDHPIPTTTDTTRWRIIQYPDVFSDIEAVSIAKQEYSKIQNSRLSIKAEPIRDATTEDKMLSKGRYGYIADTQRSLQGYNDQSTNKDYPSWAMLGTGGVLFPGMVNAMDGNLYTNTNIYDRWGKGGKIDSGVSMTIDWDEQYYWYGANSVSHAVQIVHIPGDCPMTSETSGEEMRVAVWLKNGQTSTDIDSAEFTVGLIDYSFSTSSSAKGGGCPTLSPTKEGHESVVVKDSGFYEITIPSSYSSSLNTDGATVVISFNAEYCRALLRHRCGDPTGSDILSNGNDLPHFTAFSTTNTGSIFPLGLRIYTEMSSVADDRTAWYAPTLLIDYDYNYIPATYVKYTDAGLNLSNETMVIQRVRWHIDDRNVEEVLLFMERDESLGAGGVLSYLFPTTHPGRQTTPVGGGGGDSVGGTNPGGGVEDGNNPPPGYRPESGTIGGEITPNDQNPDGGTKPFDDRGGGGSTFSPGFTGNHLTSGIYGNIKGRMALDADQYGQQGEFSILGAKKRGKTASSMRSIEGLDVDIRPSGGAAFVAADGYTLPAGTGTSESASSVRSEITSTVTVPTDVITNEIGIFATLSLGPNALNNAEAILQVKATCLESESTVSNILIIPTTTKRKTRQILPISLLTGADTPGNRIEIKVFRNADEGGDTASGHSLVLHDLKLSFRRASFITESQANKFKPAL